MYISDLFNDNEKPLEKLLPDSGFCGIFRTIGCVGDSLSSGEFQTPKADGKWRYTDMYEYSWGQFIARAAGSTVYNFSKAGMTAKRYMTVFAEEKGFWDPKLACQAYIIALGANDQRELLCPVGEASDVSADENHYPDTFAGHYSAIIRRLKTIQPNAKFFLMTMPKTLDAARNARVEHINEIVFKAAETFENCYVMDFYKYAPVIDQLWKDKFWLNGHMNPMGYLMSAKQIMSYMDYIIRHNTKDFDMVGFIGKEHLLEEN